MTDATPSLAQEASAVSRADPIRLGPFVVERAGLFGGPQKWQGLCLAHRQFEGARDTLLLTHPFRQLVGVGSRHLPHPEIQLRQRVLAHHEKGGQSQRQKRENGDRYANGDQSGAQGLKPINT